jgi:hypothetical protein
MLKNGSFERMFQGFKRPFDQLISFRDRILIRIDDPLQAPETPLMRPELWYDPRHDN